MAMKTKAEWDVELLVVLGIVAVLGLLCLTIGLITMVRDTNAKADRIGATGDPSYVCMEKGQVRQ